MEDLLCQYGWARYLKPAKAAGETLGRTQEMAMLQLVIPHGGGIWLNDTLIRVERHGRRGVKVIIEAPGQTVVTRDRAPAPPPLGVTEHERRVRQDIRLGLLQKHGGVVTAAFWHDFAKAMRRRAVHPVVSTPRLDVDLTDRNEVMDAANAAPESDTRGPEHGQGRSGSGRFGSGLGNGVREVDGGRNRVPAHRGLRRGPG